MSGPEHLPPNDHELEDFLAGRGPHAARYRAAATERAPPALDALVLAQARTLPPTRRAGLQRWRLPLSLAATLVLGIGLVTRVQREPLPPVAAGVAEPAAPVAVLTEASAEQELRARVQSAEAARAFDAAEAGRREVAARAAVSATAMARKAEAPELPPAEERQAQVGSLTGAVMATEVVAESPPPPPPPAPPPSLAAPMAMALVPASAAGSADVAAPVAAQAAPKAALRGFAGEARQDQRRVNEAAASAPAPGVTARYRSEQGRVLELSPGRYRLLAGDGSLLAEGERLVIDGGREGLQGLGGEARCRLWLEPPASEARSQRITGDCEPGLQGEYREIEPER